MNLIEILSNACLVIGTAFFTAGTIALLRFPDVYTRLHALAKVDNLGLGFIMLGLLLRTEDTATALKLALIWALILIASAVVGFLIAHRAYRRGMRHWQARKPEP